MPSVKLLGALIFVVFLFVGLYLAKGFLVPVAMAGILAMLLTPLSIWLERKRTGKVLAALLPVLLFVTVIAAVIALLSWQVAGLAEDANRLSTQINQVPKMLQEYIEHALGISVGTQQQIITSKVGERIASLLGSLVSLIGKSVMVIVYVFLFIYYRGHLREFVLKIVPAHNTAQTEKIIDSSGVVAQEYITGLARMIVVLWIMYGIGFSIIGVRHALIFAVLCGVLEIVPYAGNMTGSFLTAVMAFTQGGGSMAIWVLAVYCVVQFTQGYFLEPLIVGAKVNINPMFTIVGLILGEILWGISGMILAVPLLGITKIICDNIPALEPFGFLIGDVKVRKAKVT